MSVLRRLRMRLACWLPMHCPSSKLHFTRGIRAAAASLEPSGSTTGPTLQSIGQRRNASLVAYQIEGWPIDHNAVDPPLVCAAPTLDVRRRSTTWPRRSCLYRRLRFAWCRPMCGIISERRTLAVRRRLSRDPAMLRRPHWRSLGGRRRRSSGQTFRVWPRN